MHSHLPCATPPSTCHAALKFPFLRYAAMPVYARRVLCVQTPCPFDESPVVYVKTAVDAAVDAMIRRQES